MRDRFKAFIFAILGGASALPVAREFIKNLFWDRVIQVMNPVLEAVFIAFQDYGAPLCFGLATLYFGIGRDKLAVFAHWSQRKLSLWLVLAGFGAVAFFGGVFGAWWDYRRGPIIFNWQQHSPIVIGWSGNTFGVQAFNFYGVNRSDDPVTKIKTFVKSNVDGTPVQLFFTNGQAIEPARVTIPPKERFILNVPIQTAAPNGLVSFDEFLKNFSSFTFVFEHDGEPPKEFYFSETDVLKLIDSGTKLAKEGYENAQKMTRGIGTGIRVSP